MPSAGTITHYTLTFAMLAMLLAAVHETTGYALDPAALAHTADSQWVVRKFLGIGDYLFASLCRWCTGSKLFRKSIR